MSRKSSVTGSTKQRSPLPIKKKRDRRFPPKKNAIAFKLEIKLRDRPSR
jgi:hypothetical protein